MSQAIEKCFPVHNEDNPARVIEGEAVVVSPDDSLLHSLNAVGTFIWERADGSRSIEAIVDDVCTSFDVDRTRAMLDTVDFVRDCVDKRLLILRDDPATPGH